MANTLLTIQNVNKYYGDAHVLRDIDLDIQSGEFVALVGQSGGGKSTLLRLIAGLEETSTGEIAQDGHTIDGLNVNSRVMFQDDRLLPWMSVQDNLTFGHTSDKARLAEARSYSMKLNWTTLLTPTPTHYPVANGSGWPSPAR